MFKHPQPFFCSLDIPQVEYGLWKKSLKLLRLQLSFHVSGRGCSSTESWIPHLWRKMYMHLCCSRGVLPSSSRPTRPNLPHRVAMGRRQRVLNRILFFQLQKPQPVAKSMSSTIFPVDLRAQRPRPFDRFDRFDLASPVAGHRVMPRRSQPRRCRRRGWKSVGEERRSRETEHIEGFGEE